MQLRMWTYDIAREQSPSLDFLRRLMDLSLASGYNAVGLYLEHRFAYPSAPWVQGAGAVTPEMVRTLQDEYRELQIVPCINLLGHMEGFLYAEDGARFAEERFKGMQADPTNEEFVQLAMSILDDVLQIFTSDIVHIGGDETWQLGAGAASRRRVDEYASGRLPPPPAPASKSGDLVEGVDGKAMLYGAHFGPLARRVVEAGRTPAVWGDMFFDHPQALDLMPSETVIFDWQYFRSPEHTSRRFFDAGHRAVFCPALHTYNAIWCHLPQSERNVRQHAEAAERLGALGVCVTTWELGLFGNYETILPAIRASGRILSESAPAPEDNSHEADWDPKGQGGPEAIARYKTETDAPVFLEAYREESSALGDWARLLGVELQQAGGTFGFGGIRSAIKCRLLLYSNPFLLWLHHRDELCGEPGDRALDIADRALQAAPDASSRGVCEFLRKSVEFVRLAEAAHQAYAGGEVGEALRSLAPTRQIFLDLEKVAVATNLNAGGSLADVHRCRAALEHVERVIRRVREYGDGSLGYLPSFEYLTHPKFVPHDQAAWWLINRWANE